MKKKIKETMTFDTKMGVLEKRFKVKINVNKEMKLGNYLKEKGYGALAEMML